jgi:hypothetical protein
MENKRDWGGYEIPLFGTLTKEEALKIYFKILEEYKAKFVSYCNERKQQKDFTEYIESLADSIQERLITEFTEFGNKKESEVLRCAMCTGILFQLERMPVNN